MKTLPSPPLLLPLSTFLLVAFLFTATALPSLLLFGYREVIIGVVIDKLIKFASFLRTLRSKESTVSYFQVVTALLGCREPYSALAGLWQAQTFTKSHGRGAWPGPNFMGVPLSQIWQISSTTWELSTRQTHLQSKMHLTHLAHRCRKVLVVHPQDHVADWELWVSAATQHHNRTSCQISQLGKRPRFKVQLYRMLIFTPCEVKEV